MEITIRAAHANDIKALVDLERRTVSAQYRAFMEDESVDGFIESGAIDQYVVDTIDQCMVILVDGVVAGCCVTKDNLIDLMMIDHRMHRAGLGTHLLKHVEVVLFGRYDELVLESFEDNQQADAFYRKNGWREDRVYFDDQSGVNKIVFRKGRG